MNGYFLSFLRLFFPRLNFSGEVCVDFYYHMFGFHINTLKLVRKADSQSNVVWIKSREIGNYWLHASVGVNLSTNSQVTRACPPVIKIEGILLAH